MGGCCTSGLNELTLEERTNFFCEKCLLETNPMVLEKIELNILNWQIARINDHQNKRPVPKATFWCVGCNKRRFNI